MLSALYAAGLTLNFYGDGHYMSENVRLYAFADEAGAKISAQVAAMKRNGLDGVELRGTEFGNVSDLKPEQAKEIKRIFDGEGLKVWSLGSPLGKIGILDPFEPEIQRLKRTLEIAYILGAPNIRIFSFYIPRGERPETHRTEVIDRLSEMARITDTLHSGISLCHENEKGIYGENDTRCFEILESVHEIAGVFDPANFVQSGVDTLKAWALLKDKIRYLHIKDALSDGRVAPAGKGEGNVEKIVSDFISMGGTAMTVEPHLKVFSGLKDLEREGERSGVGEIYEYPDSDSAFDAACKAIKELIK